MAMDIVVLVEKVSETHKDEKTDLVRDKFPKASYTSVMYGVMYGHQNFVKIFLDETRLSGLSIHINYKVIGLILREI